MWIRQAATTLAFAVWWGGFTFYAVFVVPAGARVLGGSVAQGFITQAVSHRINAVGAAALVVFLWNAVATAAPRRRWLLVSWVVMLAAQLVLVALHPSLGSLLDVAARSVVDHQRFYALHRVYLLTSAAEWCACLAYFALATRAWRVTPAPVV